MLKHPHLLGGKNILKGWGKMIFQENIHHWKQRFTVCMAARMNNI